MAKENNYQTFSQIDYCISQYYSKYMASTLVQEKKRIEKNQTKEFMDASGRFTLIFFDGHQKELLYMGSHSGKDVPDKIEKAGLHLIHVNEEPTYEEGKYMLVCRTLYRQAQKPENFIDPELPKQMYPDEDYSIQYVAEIEKVYEAE